MEDSHLSKGNAAIVWGGGEGVQISRNFIKINSKHILGADKNPQIEETGFL